MLDASDLSSDLTLDEKEKILSVDCNPLLSYAVWAEFARKNRRVAMKEMTRLKLYGSDPEEDPEGQPAKALPDKRDEGSRFIF